jgi:hypothetical protein
MLRETAQLVIASSIKEAGVFGSTGDVSNRIGFAGTNKMFLSLDYRRAWKG